MFYSSIVYVLLFNFIIKILTGVVENVVWPKNCGTFGVFAMTYWSTAVLGELQNVFSTLSLRLMG